MLIGASCLLDFLAISLFMAVLFDIAKNCTSVINYHVWDLFCVQSLLDDIISVISFEHAEGHYLFILYLSTGLSCM